MATVDKIGTSNLSNPTVTTNRPFSTADMDVDTGLKLKAVESKLRIEATLDDVHMDLGAEVVYTGRPVSVPNGIYMMLSAQPTGTREISVPLVKPLAGTIRAGNAEPQQSYELPYNMKYAKFYYNEYSQAVAGTNWGIDYNDVNLFNLYSNEQPLLSKYFKEVEGKHIREATLEKYSLPLTKAPVSLTKHWNSNWYVANTEFGSQPTYDSTLSDWTAEIATTLTDAATGTNGVNANIDLNTLLAIEHYAATVKRIEPLDIGGEKMYVLMLPSSQYEILRRNSPGQAGSIWVDVSALTDEMANFPGVVGRVGSLLIVKDVRYPTISVNAGNTAITVEYVEAGNEDSRNTAVYNSSSNKAWDIGFLYGKGAIATWTVRDLHFETEKTEYGKIYGFGAFKEAGTQLVEYDVDTESDTTRENFGSMVVAFSAPTIVTTA